MKLNKVRAETFRSIVDSGTVEIDGRESVSAFIKIPARQVSAVELNSPKHLSYDIQSRPSFCENIP